VLAYPDFPPKLIDFLATFERAVAEGKIEEVSPSFKDDVLAFGTKSIVNFNKTSLISNQWERIWGKCKSWEVLSVDSAQLSQNSGYLAFRWERVNMDGTVVLGRATLVFELDDQQELLVVHSHFSENPEG
jgi:ketosteroid isomerase-like protein